LKEGEIKMTNKSNQNGSIMAWGETYPGTDLHIKGPYQEPRGSGPHKGTDWSNGDSVGTPIGALLGGTVEFKLDSVGYGMRVTVTTVLDDGSIAKIDYGHIEPDKNLQQRQYVAAGQNLGKIANKETLTSKLGTLNPDFEHPHLHTGVKVNGGQVDLRSIYPSASRESDVNAPDTSGLNTSPLGQQLGINAPSPSSNWNFSNLNIGALSQPVASVTPPTADDFRAPAPAPRIPDDFRAPAVPHPTAAERRRACLMQAHRHQIMLPRIGDGRVFGVRNQNRRAIGGQ